MHMVHAATPFSALRCVFRINDYKRLYRRMVLKNMPSSSLQSAQHSISSKLS